LVPARVIQEDGKWYLDILNGTTPVVVGRKPEGPQHAAWVMQYLPPLWPSRTHTRAPKTPYSTRKAVSLAGCKHGEECQALIEEVEHPIRHFKFWNVVQIARLGAASLKPHKPGQRVVTGYLCITNQNIENKHDERFFFCSTGSPVRIPLLQRVRDRYKELVQDYQERHADDVAKRRKRHERDPSVPLPNQPEGKTPAFSRFVLNPQDANLKHGDLVYAMLTQTGRTGKVEFIIPVSVPRVGYDQSVGDRLDSRAPFKESDLRKCQLYAELCLACRVFGWVYGTGDPAEPALDASERAAYAGRVRLTHGVKKQITGTFDATLAILSSPKPTTTRFYLRPTSGPPRDGLDDRQVDYSKVAGQQLRGRKFYRHQGDRLSEQAFTSPDGKQTDQNRTVKGVVKPQSTFEFELEFENLVEIELGALLWSLELDGWHHRLGLGKPLGFGSVTIEVKEMKLLDPIQRYGGFKAGWDDDALERKKDYVTAFQEAMVGRYGRGDDGFYELENIIDLKALLAESPSLPVHYPRSTEHPQPEGKNYEWFVGNKRKDGPRIALRLATEDTEGLPVVDKFGK
jgi:CRISPR-associated protein (TIGR03986 family)